MHAAGRWRQLLQLLEAASSRSAEGQLDSADTQAIHQAVRGLLLLPDAPKAQYKKLVNDMQVGMLVCVCVCP